MAIKIKLSDQTRNPWWGCEKIAPECNRCYAAVFAPRAFLSAHAVVAAEGEWTREITREPDTVRRAPHKWPSGARVLTCSMSDFWHERVPLEWLDEALNLMRRRRILRASF